MAGPVRVKMNASGVADVDIPDLGLTVVVADVFIEFNTYQEILELRKSEDLLALLEDDFHAAGSSSLLLNDGTSDIPQADAINFLNAILETAANNPYGFLKVDSAGELATSITFDGSATVTNLIAGGNIDLNSNLIQNLADPVADTDAANKQFVLSFVNGKQWKDPVRVVASADTTLSGTPTIDGVATADGDRVLLAGQTDASENGIWEAKTGVWVRPADFPSGGSAVSATVKVSEGTVGAETEYTCTNNLGSDVIDTNNLAWVDTTSTSIIAGAGLSFAGNTLNVGAGAGLTVNATDIDVDYGLVGDIQPLANALSAGSLDLAARADHTHTHGDRGGDGAVSQHDAQQVDVTGTYTNITGTPSSAEAAFAAIDANFSNEVYVGKILQCEYTNKVKGSSPTFLWSGHVALSSVPFAVLRAGTLETASVSLEDVDATRTYDVAFEINGAPNATVLSIPINTQTVVATNLGIPLPAASTLATTIQRKTGSGNSSFKELRVLMEYRDA